MSGESAVYTPESTLLNWVPCPRDGDLDAQLQQHDLFISADLPRYDLSFSDMAALLAHATARVGNWHCFLLTVLAIIVNSSSSVSRSAY